MKEDAVQRTLAQQEQEVGEGDVGRVALCGQLVGQKPERVIDHEATTARPGSLRHHTVPMAGA